MAFGGEPRRLFPHGYPPHTWSWSHIIEGHEAGRPCRLSARLSRCLRRTDHRQRWASYEDPRGSGASGYARVFVCQGGEVSGSRVFAGSGAVSDAADWDKRAGGAAELRSTWTAGGGCLHTSSSHTGLAADFLGRGAG